MGCLPDEGGRGSLSHGGRDLVLDGARELVVRDRGRGARGEAHAGDRRWRRRLLRGALGNGFPAARLRAPRIAMKV